jgi:Rad3-related DNA helicase
MNENKKASLVWIGVKPDAIYWEVPNNFQRALHEEVLLFVSKDSHDALAEQVKTMSDNCISLSLHNSRVDALEKQIEELKAERDGARAALEDRDQMHELQLQGIKKQMFRQEAELRSENKELRAIANSPEKFDLKEHLDLQRRHMRLNAENDKLREKLGVARSYMEHKDSCDSRNASTAYDFGPRNCDCGFDEALAKIEETNPRKDER